jgi:hypothetical protein
VTEADLLGSADLGFLGQLRETTRFRTNVGFVNPSAVECAVQVTLTSDTGGQLGVPVPAVVPAGGWYQLNDVFTLARVSAAELATATVQVTTAGCLVWAYASVVDNGSGDPTTIPVAAD